ncbi:MAG: histidine--tRNA ligase [Desulfobacteraceae bacterium]|nr:histidine--tRNA ligase [Desulfobacteraceae bacterium]MCF8095492.1 histidine--tRNA ligase [Desulfobacteraceae bacterium]
MIQLVRGFRDILPPETSVWQYVESIAKEHFENFGFREMRPPVLEQAALFQRSIGEHTDIVEKEMYTFAGSKDTMLTLRPEATASVVRAYIQHKLYSVDPICKFYTIGPMFRKERPQKGRYRQFHQINAEVFGVDSPYMDAQLIFMLMTYFARLSITGLRAHLNSLGCPECRPAFRQNLSDMLSARTEKLCEDCVRRLDKNPLRVLDCKKESCREAVADAPSMIDFLCGDCKRHFAAVQSVLDRMDVPFEIDTGLVRGLDYYTRTAFEIQTEELGAQNAVAGGGRYDNLVEMLGGPSQPAIGFAVGVDRLVELVEAKFPAFDAGPDVFFVPMGDAAMEMVAQWVCRLADAGIRTEADFSGRSLKALMRRADRMEAKNVLIVGDKEIAENEAVLRNMKTRDQVGVPMDRLVDTVREKVAREEF